MNLNSAIHSQHSPLARSSSTESSSSKISQVPPFNSGSGSDLNPATGSPQSDKGNRLQSNSWGSVNATGDGSAQHVVRAAPTAVKNSLTFAQKLVIAERMRMILMAGTQNKHLFEKYRARYPDDPVYTNAQYLACAVMSRKQPGNEGAKRMPINWLEVVPAVHKIVKADPLATATSSGVPRKDRRIFNTARVALIRGGHLQGVPENVAPRPGGKHTHAERMKIRSFIVAEENLTVGSIEVAKRYALTPECVKNVSRHAITQQRNTIGKHLTGEERAFNVARFGAAVTQARLRNDPYIGNLDALRGTASANSTEVRTSGPSTNFGGRVRATQASNQSVGQLPLPRPDLFSPTTSFPSSGNENLRQLPIAVPGQGDKPVSPANLATITPFAFTPPQIGGVAAATPPAASHSPDKLPILTQIPTAPILTWRIGGLQIPVGNLPPVPLATGYQDPPPRSKLVVSATDIDGLLDQAEGTRAFWDATQELTRIKNGLFQSATGNNQLPSTAMGGVVSNAQNPGPTASAWTPGPPLPMAPNFSHG